MVYKKSKSNKQAFQVFLFLKEIYMFIIKMKDKRQNVHKDDKNVTFKADPVHFEKTFGLGYQNPESKNSVVRFLLLLDLTEFKIKSEMLEELINLKIYLLSLLSDYKQIIFNNKIHSLSDFIIQVYTLAVERRDYDGYLKFKDENKDKYHKNVLSLVAFLNRKRGCRIKKKCRNMVY